MLHDEKPESAGRITRKALIASGIGAVAALGVAGRAFGQGTPNEAAIQAALQSGIPPDDGLAHPIPYTPPLGTGKDRGLALGGGAIYLVSWYSGYFTSLAQNGVDLKLADVMVGTSAGTLGNYAILMDTVAQMKSVMEGFGQSPASMNYSLAPPFSAQRAGYVGNSLPTASVANIQELGPRSDGSPHQSGYGVASGHHAVDRCRERVAVAEIPHDRKRLLHRAAAGRLARRQRSGDRRDVGIVFVAGTRRADAAEGSPSYGRRHVRILDPFRRGRRSEARADRVARFRG